MPHIDTELSSDWLNYATASIGTRIRDTEHITEKVLNAVQAIAAQLSDKQELEALLSIKSDEATSSEILPLLHDVLNHLDSQDALAQLIAPLFTALQFEDRTRQKLEGLIKILSTWADVRNDDSISDEILAAKLKQHVVSMEQQAILAKYFANYIQVEEESDEVAFF